MYIYKYKICLYLCVRILHVYIHACVYMYSYTCISMLIFVYMNLTYNIYDISIKLIFMPLKLYVYMCLILKIY